MRNFYCSHEKEWRLTPCPHSTCAEADWTLARVPWEPQWKLAPALVGEDEGDVEAVYRIEVPNGPPWGDLAEWQRESWRRECRD